MVEATPICVIYPYEHSRKRSDAYSYSPRIPYMTTCELDQRGMRGATPCAPGPSIYLSAIPAVFPPRLQAINLAALCSGCLVACQGLITATYIEDGILAAVPVVLGSMSGTRGTCKFDSRRHQTGTNK